MREIDRQIFYGRCDRELLSGRSCALRAIAELDEQLVTKRALAKPEDREKTIPDMVKVHLEHPGAESAFKSSSGGNASARFVCQLCDQSIRVTLDRGKDTDGVLEIQPSFPLQCNAYLDVRSSDLTAHVDQLPDTPTQ